MSAHAHVHNHTRTQVQLMTMHRAKGREFTHVFLAGWEEGVFPLMFADGDDNVMPSGRGGEAELQEVMLTSMKSSHVS